MILATIDGNMIPMVSVTAQFESDCHSVTHDSSDTPTDSDIIFIQLSINFINNSIIDSR